MLKIKVNVVSTLHHILGTEDVTSLNKMAASEGSVQLSRNEDHRHPPGLEVGRGAAP